jgi:hypothetical protein
MIQGHRDRVETNARLLQQATWLLDRAHLRCNLLVDITTAHTINSIIHNVDAERQRWLRAVDSPLP